MLTALNSRAYRKALTKRLSGFSVAADLPSGGRAEQQLIDAMFMALGRLAKMDGRVTVGEINYAEQVMKRMALCGDKRRQAIIAYDRGKHPDSELFAALDAAARVVGRRSALAKLFLQIQCEAAYLKGNLRLKDKMLLRDVAEEFGYTKSELLAIASSLQSEQYQRAQADPRSAFFKPHSRTFLHNAYRILQLEPEAEDGEIRRAYLRMMSRYHPDKLAGSNVSASALREAQEHAMAIRNAYEELCGYRKLRA